MSSSQQMPQSSQDQKLPELPLTCLQTAEFTNTLEAFRGRNTVIDFWTTKCTRCPAALDSLQSLSLQPRYASIRFVSICCDSCDGARNIIEETDEPRWNNISHYYMDTESKEVAKKVLGFKQVPFYVVLDEEGSIVMKGSKKHIDFEKIPGVEEECGELASAPATPAKDKQSEETLGQEKNALDTSPTSVMMDRVFLIDDDF